MQRSTPFNDKAEEILAQYEKDEKEYRDHWVWKELQCRPEEFFKAVKKHVQSLNIPQQQWNEAYAKAKDASRVRSAEKRGAYRPMNLRLIGALRA